MTGARPFTDRREAGRVLARSLGPSFGRRDLVVLGVPRGGVPVAFEVARYLDAPLDVLVARKIGVPRCEELALGAVAAGGAAAMNADLASELGIPPRLLDEAREREAREAARRERSYRRGRPPLDLSGRTAMIIDDGMATGATLKAACRAARNLGAARVVAAAAVGTPDAPRRLEGAADRLVCAVTMPFLSVDEAYEDFSEVSDEEVSELMREASPV